MNRRTIPLDVTMEIPIPFFEHLLNCMRNQKDVHRVLGEEDRKEIQKELNEAWEAGMTLLKEAKVKLECTCISDRTSGCYVHGYSDLLSRRT